MVASIADEGALDDVVESRDDGRATVRFDNGQLLMGRDPRAFERVGERAEGESKVSLEMAP